MKVLVVLGEYAQHQRHPQLEEVLHLQCGVFLHTSTLPCYHAGVEIIPDAVLHQQPHLLRQLRSKLRHVNEVGGSGIGVQILHTTRDDGTQLPEVVVAEEGPHDLRPQPRHALIERCVLTPEHGVCALEGGIEGGIALGNFFLKDGALVCPSELIQYVHLGEGVYTQLRLQCQ